MTGMEQPRSYRVGERLGAWVGRRLDRVAVYVVLKVLDRQAKEAERRRRRA